MEVTNIKFHENRSSGTRADKCRHTENKQKDRQTDG